MKSMKGVNKVFLLVTIIGYGLLAFGKSTNLIIENRKNQKEYIFVIPQGEFTLGYVHSVMKTNVEENFVVNNEKITLKSTVYQSYGVGLPFLPEEGDLEIIDGKFVLKINRDFEKIHMTISPLGNHYLRIAGKTYPFKEMFGEETVKITLKVSKKINIKF
ncbi:DUF1850 domain-containing protein [Fusobacterium sp. PH5-44]|uniref:DUF1850 domain-containing protein n=1 Tax=unclassified Fusobacterium TaxID=2648384 RepID=UPI003D1F7D8D